MPIVALLAVGGIGGFLIGRGADAASGLVKWLVIGAGVFVAARAFKVI